VPDLKLGPIGFEITLLLIAAAAGALIWLLGAPSPSPCCWR
jgi:hypothetical protein